MTANIFFKRISPIFKYLIPMKISLCTLNINKSNERKWLYTKKNARIRWYPAETIMDYVDDIALLANVPTQAESMLYSLNSSQ